MRAIIIRHRKVDFQWKKWSTSEQFNKDCKMYDEAPIFSLLSDVPQMNYQNIYTSSLQRSKILYRISTVDNNSLFSNVCKSSYCLLVNTDFVVHILVCRKEQIYHHRVRRIDAEPMNLRNSQFINSVCINIEGR